MKKESLDLQQKFLDKLEEWRGQPDFNSTKFNRAKGMLQATHPDVLTEVLGITTVPDAPREAMNRIRTMDLSTLKNLEIFRGLDDKVVGHHMSAFGAISGTLENQSPVRRLELLNRAIDGGYITGMDPTGIGPIRTSIHRPIAHQGDFSGKKPGYKTPTFSNTDNLEDVWTSLESSLKQQQGSFMEARAHQSTQDLVSASRGAFGGDLITDLDVPMETRAAASKAADSVSGQIQEVITKYTGNDSLIQKAVQPFTQHLPKIKMVNGVARLGVLLPVVGGGFDVADAAERTRIASQPNATPIDKVQAGLAQTAATTAFVPEPNAQVVNFTAGAANMIIDFGRFAMGKQNELTQGAAKSFTGASTGRY